MKKIAIQLLKEASWAPVGVVVLHAVCGELFGHEPYVDPVMHFLGGAAIAYFLRRMMVLGEAYVGRPSAFGLDLMSFGLASVAAVVWEFAEWFSDVFLDTNIQRSGAAPLRDLAIGMVGAVVYLFLKRVLGEKYS